MKKQKALDKETEIEQQITQMQTTQIVQEMLKVKADRLHKVCVI